MQVCDTNQLQSLAPSTKSNLVGAAIAGGNQLPLTEPAGETVARQRRDGEGIRDKQELRTCMRAPSPTGCTPTKRV